MSASNARLGVVAHGEVGVERAEGEPSAGTQRAGHAVDDDTVLPVRRHQAERPLAEADHGLELAVERQGAGVEALERRTVGRVTAGQVDERLGDVDAVHDDAAVGELVGVAPWAAPDVEHPLARHQSERADDVVDLLHGPLRERVAQVRRPEVIGDRFEPVVAGHAVSDGGHVIAATTSLTSTSSTALCSTST